MRPSLPAAYAWLLVASLGCALVGCGGEAKTPPAPQATSGAEAAGGTEGSGSGAEPTGAEVAPAAQSAWGKTRAEKCKPAPRRTIDERARRLIERGLAAERQGDASTAKDAFSSALAADRDAFVASYNLGVLADRAGDESQALERYRAALLSQPDYAPAAEGIVAIRIRHGDVDQALAFVQGLAQQFPTNTALQALDAEVLVQARRYDAAWDAIRRALQCDERSVPALTAAVKASQAQGRDEMARSILDQAIKIDPNDAELHYLNGQMLAAETGSLRQALDEYRKAVALEPSYVEARVALGEQLLGAGNYAEAVKQFEAAVKLAPSLVATHLDLADAYRANGQWADAMREFKVVASMQPDLPALHYDLGMMYMAAGGDFPGLDELGALRQAEQELQRYRDFMGPKLGRDDPSAGYLADIQRRIERTERRLEREAQRRKREQERAARSGQDAGQAGQDTGQGGGSK
ncbi:MAG: tetratricopeptide repeat protein [Myxococcales bacterium]|nr:tetratricopeptide repeat protein [Myxococcales bacterium]